MPKLQRKPNKLNHRPEDFSALADLFKSLGHPLRLMMVEMLQEGERCVCELHEHSGRDISTVSSHLSILKTQGVLRSEQRGKQVYYSLALPCLLEVFHCIRDSKNGSLKTKVCRSCS